MHTWSISEAESLFRLSRGEISRRLANAELAAVHGKGRRFDGTACNLAYACFPFECCVKRSASMHLREWCKLLIGVAKLYFWFCK